MSTQPTSDPVLLAMHDRLRHLEAQVGDIHRALVGSMDGSAKGLQARVERLEGWAKWLAGLATMAIGAAITSLVRGMH